MNEEDKRVFEEWDKGLENCKCAACTEHRMRTLYPIWNAALEYERSRQSHPTTDELVRVLRELIEQTPDCPCVNRELWTPIAESLLQRLRFSPSEESEKLKARIAELEAEMKIAMDKIAKYRASWLEADANAGCNYRESEKAKRENDLLRSRIAELEAAKSAPAQEPERVFTPCPEHSLVIQMRANETGEHWSHCPWCGKSLWRTRKVVTTQRNAIATPAIGKDEWAIYVAAFAGDTPAMTIGDIPAKATITFEVKE